MHGVQVSAFQRSSFCFATVEQRALGLLLSKLGPGQGDYQCFQAF